MPTTKNQLENSLAIFIILAVGLKLAIFFYHAWPFTTDDAFISWRYALHLAEGDGLRWNLLGDPVEGYSNFSWVILVSLFIKLGWPVIAAVKCFSLFSLVAALFFLYQFSRMFLSPLLATLPLYLLSHYKGIVWWTVSGLETSFFMALVLFVNWQILRAMGFNKFPTGHQQYRPGAWISSCIGLTLLALTRFEGAVWAFIIVVFVACALWNENRTRLSNTTLTSIFLIFVLFFVLPYSLYFSWRFFYFGHLLPNSYICKAMASGFQFELIIVYLSIAFPCIMIGLPYFFAGKDCRKILFWLPSLIYALLLYHASPNIAYYNRLFLPAFGVLSVLPVLGIQEFFSYFHLKATSSAIASTLFILLFTQVFIPGSRISVIDTAIKHYQQRSAMRHQIALQLSHKVAKGGRVVLADTGIIPFYARNDIQFIDSLCLNNGEMAAIKLNHSGASYANQLKQSIKPEWIIDTYYPKLRHGNTLNDELQADGFYNQYKLIKTYQSHRFSYQHGLLQEQEADFSYRIYQRTSQP